VLDAPDTMSRRLNSRTVTLAGAIRLR
jgi:hypothetical protein